MNERSSIELLPWLLNGTLEGEERASVVAALREDPAHRAALADTMAAFEAFDQHPEASVLVDLAYDRFGGDRRALQLHLALCPGCAEQAAMARASRALEDAGSQVTVLVPRRRRWRLPAAIAAALGAVLGLGVWTELHRPVVLSVPPASAASQATTNSKVLQPASMVVRGIGDDAVRVAAGGSFFVQLALEGNAHGVDLWRMVIEPAGGGPEPVPPILVAHQETASFVNVLLPGDRFPAGEYRIRLYARRGANERLYDEYTLRVARDA